MVYYWLWSLSKRINRNYIYFKKYRPIHPLKFHEELLKKRLLKLKRGETYTDLKTRCHVELHRNQRYFQPKGWSVEKLLYNYDLSSILPSVSASNTFL